MVASNTQAFYLGCLLRKRLQPIRGHLCWYLMSFAFGVSSSVLCFSSFSVTGRVFLAFAHTPVQPPWEEIIGKRKPFAVAVTRGRAICSILLCPPGGPGQ